MAGKGEGLPIEPGFQKEPFVTRSIYFGTYFIAGLILISNIDYTRVAFTEMGVRPDAALAFAGGIAALEMCLATVVLNKEAMGIILATVRRIPSVIQEQEEFVYRWGAVGITAILVFSFVAMLIGLYWIDAWTTFRGARAPNNIMGYVLTAVFVIGPEILLMAASVIKWIARSSEIKEAPNTIRWKIQKAADDAALQGQLENLRLKRQNEQADRRINRQQAAKQRQEKYEQAGLGGGGSGGVMGSLKRMASKMAGAIGGGNKGGPPPSAGGMGGGQQPMGQPMRR